jgi:hypothetical protein
MISTATVSVRHLTLDFAFSLFSLYTICALLQISLMQLCRFARHFWTDALVPYRENIFSGIFFRRSGFATVRRQDGVFLTIAYSRLGPRRVAGASTSMAWAGVGKDGI